MRSSQHSSITLILFLGICVLAMWLSSPPSQKSYDRSRKLASASGEMDFRARQVQRTQKRISPFERSKVQLNFEQLKANSLRFAQINDQSSVEEGAKGETAEGSEQDWVIPQNTELIALIDRDCTRQPSQMALASTRSFSYQLVDPNVNRTGLKKQYYPFSLTRDMGLAEIEELAADDPCLIGLTENGQVRAGGLYDDPSVSRQEHLQQIEALPVEDFFFHSSLSTSAPVVIAVVDSGVDHRHVDLSNNMWDDGQGNHGYDFINEDKDPMDDNFHGTHVAGLAASIGGNSTGGSGVMPSNVRIMAVKILDEEGNGDYGGVANGIRWAIENGADLINLSLSGSGRNSGVADALIEAVNNGIPVFVSAGNGGGWLSDSSNFRTPTSYGAEIDGVMTVGATDAVTSRRSSFSNYNPDYVEISAPGSNGIYSTLPGNSFGELEGTSMSTPITAGAAAIVIQSLKSKNYSYTAAEIEEILAQSAFKNEELADDFAQGRQLNLSLLKEHLLNNYLVQLDGGVFEDEN